jgi:uncharacterized lipoprotein YmbA
MSRPLTVFAALGAAVLVAACGTSAKPAFYRLSPTAPEHAQAATSYTVALEAVTVPDVVDRPQMVLYITENTVEVRDLQRWAESLKGNLGRVVADNLSRELGQKLVVAYPASGSMERPDYRVWIDVQSFESRRGVSATLDAMWGVKGPGPEATVTGRTTAVETAGEGFESLVAAHSRAAGRLSADIAAAIRSLPPAGR